MNADQRAALKYFAALCTAYGDEISIARRAWIDVAPATAGDPREMLLAMASVLTERQAHKVVACLSINAPNVILEASNGLV